MHVTSSMNCWHCVIKDRAVVRELIPELKCNLEEADRRAKHITVPAGDPYSPKPIFSRMSRMNSHEWKEVSFVSCP